MIEVRIPISPTPSFLARAKLIHASLCAWYPDTRMTLGCYPPPEPSLPPPSNISWWFTPTDAEFDAWRGSRAPHMSTVASTWRNPFLGDHVLHLDGDVLPIARFDELLTIDALMGVPAHHSPFSPHMWATLFTGYGLPPPPLNMPFSGFGSMFTDPGHALGPSGYFNSGMIFGPRHLFERLAPAYAEATAFLKGTLADTYWIDQLSFVLAVHQAGIPTVALPLRYNFPNRPSFDRANPVELAAVRFLHFMQTDTVDRDKDFETPEAIAALAARTDLTGSNEVLRRRVAKIRGAVGF